MRGDALAIPGGRLPKPPVSVAGAAHEAFLTSRPVCRWRSNSYYREQIGDANPEIIEKTIIFNLLHYCKYR
ncbi:MAG: hypothetical protein H7X91_11330 [Burkholderiales bacterium]|nr:hypothetical protein [Burkholderiales bacterium]